MGFLKRLFAVILNKFADIEFDLVKSWRYHYCRNMYLRLIGVDFKEKSRFGKKIYIKNGINLSLGERCCIGSFTKIWDYDKVVIGDDFLSAGLLTINSGTHDLLNLKPIVKPVKIGKRVWCGVNVTILAGVQVGDDVVIGAGTLVNKSIPSNSVVVGVPARIIKTIDRENTELYNQHNW